MKNIGISPKILICQAPDKMTFRLDSRQINY